MACHHLAIAACVILFVYFLLVIDCFPSITSYWVCNFKRFGLSISLSLWFLFYGFLLHSSVSAWTLIYTWFFSVMQHSTGSLMIAFVILGVIHSWAYWTLGWMLLCFFLFFSSLWLLFIEYVPLNGLLSLSLLNLILWFSGYLYLWVLMFEHFYLQGLFLSCNTLQVHWCFYNFQGDSLVVELLGHWVGCRFWWNLQLLILWSRVQTEEHHGNCTCACCRSYIQSPVYFHIFIFWLEMASFERSFCIQFSPSTFKRTREGRSGRRVVILTTCREHHQTCFAAKKAGWISNKAECWVRWKRFVADSVGGRRWCLSGGCRQGGSRSCIHKLLLGVSFSASTFSCCFSLFRISKLNKFPPPELRADKS